MRRIDFVGPSGTGKTTIVNALMKEHKCKYIITPREAKLRYVLSQEVNRDLKYKILVTRLLNNFGVKKLALILSDQLLIKKSKDLLWENRKKYRSLLEVVIEKSFSTTKEPIGKVQGLIYFYDILKEVLITEKLEDKLTVLFGESLMIKPFGLCSWDEPVDLQFLKFYYENISKPDIVVELKIDIHKNLVRVKNRENLVMAHRDITDEKLLKRLEIQAEILKIGVAIMKKRGVQIIKVDSEKPISSNIKYLINNVGDLF